MAAPPAPPPNAIAAGVLGLPWWNAPVPFNDIEQAVGQTNKVSLDGDQTVDITRALQKFCKSGNKGRPARKHYLTDSQLTVPLNMYNARTPATFQTPWAYFHDEITVIPRAAPAGFAWNGIPLSMPTDPGFQNNFNRDLIRPWNSIALNGPNRPNRSDIHYRLLCFIHKHEDPLNPDDFYSTVYSMSVFDRETNELAWHDPSTHNSALRLADINTFWTNVNTDFPTAFPPAVVHVPYTGLRSLSGFLHWTLDPVFTQKSIIGIAIWMMNNIGAPAAVPGQGPRPPDTIETVSGGGDDTLVPQLLECAWLTLRENARPGSLFRGNTIGTRNTVCEMFGMAEGDNPWLRTALNRRLRVHYPWVAAPPKPPDEWIPRAFLNDNAG